MAWRAFWHRLSTVSTPMAQCPPSRATERTGAFKGPLLNGNYTLTLLRASTAIAWTDVPTTGHRVTIPGLVELAASAAGWATTRQLTQPVRRCGTTGTTSFLHCQRLVLGGHSRVRLERKSGPCFRKC